MIRLGLCCIFREQPIKFRTTTAAATSRLPKGEALAKLSAICLANADALAESLRYCAAHGIGCFRVNSQILPIKTHPQQGYRVEDLPEADEIIRRFKTCGRFAIENNIRTCFHPDQFVVMNSSRPEVVRASIEELEYQAEVADWISADVINIHAGGTYGGEKTKALDELARNLAKLSDRVRSRLTVENDDKLFTPADLLPWCRSTGIPFVYDVHHHRCKRDNLSEQQATKMAIGTWNREPLFHLSSPLDGWPGPRPERHHDFIAVDDFPKHWLELNVTVEVEAKAKELAIARLRLDLEGMKKARKSRRKK